MVVLEPYIDCELYVVGSDDFSVCNFVSLVKAQLWFD